MGLQFLCIYKLRKSLQIQTEWRGEGKTSGLII